MKKDKTRFKRLLRTGNSEFFQIDLADDDRTAFLLYVDCRDVENPIDIYLIAHFQVSEKSYEEILSFNNDMLSMKPTRHYYMKDLILTSREFEYDFPEGMDAIIDFINLILQDKNSALELGGIQNNDFNFLSQE